MNTIFFSAYKQAIRGRKMITKIPYTKNAFNLTVLFYEHGYLNYYVIRNNGTMIELFLKYFEGKPIINNFIFISNPGHRKFCSYRKLLRLINTEKKTLLLSTNQGILFGNESVSRRIGGEIICTLI